MTTTEQPVSPAEAFAPSHGPEPMSPADAMAALHSMLPGALAAASGAAQVSPATPRKYPKESLLWLTLSSLATALAAVVPGPVSSRSTDILVTGLITLVTAFHHGAAIRRR